MDFRLELKIKPFPKQLRLPGPVMLIGSCFTDHISKKLAAHKFRVLENPFGILFNPASIVNALEAAVRGREYTFDDLFFSNELWNSWDHHGSFSHPDPLVALRNMNTSVKITQNFLCETEWVIITLGSAWVYELKNNNFKGEEGMVAANCHKVPQQQFNHRLLTTAETSQKLREMVDLIRQQRSLVPIIFTISPVRHHREGLVENNRSKALLITAVHELLESYEDLFYFPSYELVMDDLRDYRFFAEDLVHPNYQATRYVWEKFSEACIDASSRKDMEDIARIVQAKNHRSLHPSSPAHQKFLAMMLERTRDLQQRLPLLDFSEEEKEFLNLKF